MQLTPLAMRIAVAERRKKTQIPGFHQQQIAEIVNMKLRYQRRLANAKIFRIEVCADGSSIP
jgi:hypothetical protein